MSSRELTFFLTDIERSTAHVRRLGERYCEVLDGSRGAINRAVVEHGGREIECRADESFAVFDSAADAVAAALQAQRELLAVSWPHGAPVRVRIGLHTGPAIDTGQGLVGFDVHLAARLAAAGHGGQVLLSGRTAELAGAETVDLGLFELRGVPEPQRLLQLVADGLPQDFPPPRFARRVDDDRLSVVLADDSMLVRDGIARLLEEAGIRVVGQAGSPDELLERVAATAPDVAVVDIRMPPSGTDEGVSAAKTIRELHPDTGVLLLSQDFVPAYARELLEASGEAVGYLLKDRVADMTEFAGAIRRIADGDVVLDDEFALVGTA
ncbi:MAG TPA: response regulator [Gaiellaceae bacterium]|nr:response regulator [Gaiellaceae bacterium]